MQEHIWTSQRHLEKKILWSDETKIMLIGQKKKKYDLVYRDIWWKVNRIVELYGKPSTGNLV